MNHNDRIRQAFAHQAQSFGLDGLTLSSQAYLDWMVAALPLESPFHVLDVAAGTGHLSRAIAPHVRQVVALDLTPEMLDRAQSEAMEAGLSNIGFGQGDAAALTYADDTFDMVVSRLAIHHFQEPALHLCEMVRVCKPGHIVGIIDLLSPSDRLLIEAYNRLERLRDPSHTTALTEAQMVQMMTHCGLEMVGADSRQIEVDFERWVEMTGVGDATREEIRTELVVEVAGGAKTGMRPHVSEDRLKFWQTWSVLLGSKT